MSFLKDDNQRKVFLTGAAVGAAAFMGGLGRWIDSRVPGYERNKSSDPYYLIVRGALIGGLIALPGSAYLINRGVNMKVLGSAPTAKRPLWHDFTVPESSASDGSMSFKNDIDGTSYFMPAPPKNV
jgi:hypothetical protein